jgi:hypothetical protein
MAKIVFLVLSATLFSLFLPFNTKRATKTAALLVKASPVGTAYQ